jgi:SAM-dependent methyltransferase
MTALGVARSDSIIDVGGGASRLVDHLVAAGFEDVTVLDVSGVAIDMARDRVGSPPGVRWMVDDVLTWSPARKWDVWHDRMLLHFLLEAEQRATYLDTLRRALVPDGVVIICTFADDGPEMCSALPVRRYSIEALTGLLGPGAEIVETRRVTHTTPGGVAQAHSWIAARLSQEAGAGSRE